MVLVRALTVVSLSVVLAYCTRSRLCGGPHPLPWVGAGAPGVYTY